MENNWYYVENGERQGPVEAKELIEKIKAGLLGEDDYVWTKGLENWQKLKDVEEFQSFLAAGEEATEISEDETEEVSATDEPPIFDVSQVPFDKRKFTIKIGKDRGQAADAEYGPYSIDILKRLFKEKRINAKTQVFTPGMSDWEYLAALPFYEKVFNEAPPTLPEKRSNLRKPFVARMFFHNQSELFEGTCRDISVGGMQVLVHEFPGKPGEQISINVHPENSDYCFVASGKIVRLLDGGQGFSFRFLALTDEAKTAIQSYISSEE